MSGEKRDQVVWVGCTCNGGKVAGGPAGHPVKCTRCGGSGVVPAPVPHPRTSDSLSTEKDS